MLPSFRKSPGREQLPESMALQGAERRVVAAGGAEGRIRADRAPEAPGGAMEEIEEELDDEVIVEDEDAAVDEAEEAAVAATPAKDVPEGDVESIEELIVKKESQAAEEEDDDAVLSLTRDERLEPVPEKVVPPQSSEFVCKKCYLVKHRSQLKDRARTLCRDCA